MRNGLFFTSISTTEGDVCGITCIRLYGAVGFIAIRDFSSWGESDLLSDLWPVMDEEFCVNILLQGVATISNNFT